VTHSKNLADLRKFIQESISDNIRDRISGFVDEVVELSKEIGSGRDQSIKQLKWLKTEIESIVQFFERNDEKLAVVIFKRLLVEVEKFMKLTSFWNRPKVIGRKEYLQKVKAQAEAISNEAGIAKKLMFKLKRKTVKD